MATRRVGWMGMGRLFIAAVVLGDVTGTAVADADALAGHGRLLAVQSVPIDPVFADVASARVRFWYLSTATGKDGFPATQGLTVVTAGMMLPKGTPANGHLPIVSWAHGGTTINYRSVPSAEPGFGGTNFTSGGSGAVVYAPLFHALLEAGYAVVSTDYQGVGTPGLRPLFATSDGANMIDAVIAARQLEPHLSKKWFSAGHSGGGQAALRAGDLSAQGYDGDLELQGTVPIEPASTFTWWFGPSGFQFMAGTKNLLMAIFIGLKEIHPELNLADYLGPDALTGDRLQTLYYGTEADVLAAYNSVPISQFSVGTGSAANNLRTWLQDISVPQLRSQHPLYWPESAATAQLPIPLVSHGQQQACTLGDTSYVNVYSNVSHNDIVAGSAADVVHWMNDRLAGVSAPSNCP